MVYSLYEMILFRAVYLTTMLPAKGYSKPNVKFDTSGLQSAATKLAFFLAIVWILFFISKFILPSKRNAMAQQGGGGAKYAGAALGILCLLDLDIITKIANWSLDIIWKIGQAFGIV